MSCNHTQSELVGHLLCVHNEAFADGVQTERARIIKLLETDMEHAFGDDNKCLYISHYREVCNCDIIALIKGEN